MEIIREKLKKLINVLDRNLSIRVMDILPELKEIYNLLETPVSIEQQKKISNKEQPKLEKASETTETVVEMKEETIITPTITEPIEETKEENKRRDSKKIYREVSKETICLTKYRSIKAKDVRIDLYIIIPMIEIRDKLKEIYNKHGIEMYIYDNPEAEGQKVCHGIILLDKNKGKQAMVGFDSKKKHITKYINMVKNALLKEYLKYKQTQCKKKRG